MAQNIPHKIASLTAALAALTFSIGIHATDAGPDFAPATTQTVGTNPRGLASADLNGDGVPDLVSVNNDTGNISVLLGKTDNSGGFDPAVNYDVTDPANVNASPFSVAIGDVVGDASLDLVVAKTALGSGDNEIAILVGDGTGVFATPITISPAPVYNDPRDVILLDIDADGDLEIVVAEWGAGGSVRVFLNDDAAITFTEAPNSPFASGAFPFGMVYADATGDGIDDLVLVNNDSSNTVTILHGTNNPGFFQPPTTVVATGSVPYSVAVADLDGILGADLVVANSGAGANSISVLLSAGDTTLPPDGINEFVPKVDTAVGTTPNEVAVVNISGDTNLDVVVTNRGSNNISVLEGDGTGGFSGAASPFPAGTSPSALAVSDFDGDGNVDMAAANIGNASTSVSVLISDHPPVAVDNAFDVLNGSTNIALDVLANDSDPDVGDTLTITAVGAPSLSGTVTINGTADGLIYGNTVDTDTTETFTYTIADQFGYTATATVTISLIAPNAAPSFTSTPVTAATQDSLYTYNITTTDPNAGDILAITATTLPSWLTLTDNGDGTAVLTGTPANANVGDSPVALLVTDDGTGNLTGTQAFTINVANVNDAPVAVGSIGAQSGTEDAAFGPLDVSGNFSDPDGDPLAYTLSGLPAGTGLTIGVSNAVMSGTLTAADAAASPITVTVTATDPGSLFATQQFTLTVDTINVAPSFTSTPVTTATQGTAYSYDITSTDANAGDTLTITAPTLPAWLTLTDNNDGTATLSGTPASTDVGDDPVSLLVTDSGVGSLTDVQAFTITVAAAPSSGGGGGGGGGCTLNTVGSSAKDPLIPLLLVAAMGALYRRRNRKSIKDS